ncbi:hypothetical protein KDK95_15145 [Actinospica sp. MGRD01-02]|uniref:Gram-positive cocci surface proteins LPxTG domain-containing protein n=1 Tax=Actinospica acidithermotolerans TaxID=2828514 RepID=A0A941IK15_9ACTN|nr:hypothetical protein [Actinospica acidithermotolerans]MBR7827653.1 hypothetical protein [Actinospica acidithermotolerans]
MKSGTRWSTALALVAAAWVTVGGVAHADTVYGVTVPDAAFTAGTGTQTLDITIAPNSRVVGSADQVGVSSVAGLVTGISASGAGGTCSGSPGAWICQPSGTTWRAGDIRVYVSTATATCGNSMEVCGREPLTADVDGAGLPIEITGSIFIGAAPTPSPSPTTPAAQPSKAAPSSAPTTPASTRAAAEQAATVAASQVRAPASTSPSPPSPPATSASPPRSASPTTEASSASRTKAAVAAASSPPSGVVDLADTSSSSTMAVVGLAIAFLLVGATSSAWIRRNRRER